MRDLDTLDVEAIIYDKRPDLVQPFLDAVSAARRVANGEHLFLIRRTDREPIDDNLFYMAKDWDEAKSIVGELISGTWGYGFLEADDTGYEVLDVVVVRSETFRGDEEE